jgi:histidinol-phosphate aminotransferase
VMALPGVRPASNERAPFHVRPAEAVSRTSPYRPALRDGPLEERQGEILKLDSNEADTRPSPLVYDRIREFLVTGHLNWYPDLEAARLRESLSGYTSRPPGQIRVYNGSDSALESICRTFLERGDHVVISSPTYDNFRVFAEGLGARAEFAFAPRLLDSNARELVRAVTSATKLVYLCNPDNPTGRTYDEETVGRLLEVLRNGILVVDEAYFEFSRITMDGLRDRYPHLVITRTFSKAFGLAALRCGYVLADERCLGLMDRIRNGKDVNALAQVAAVAALEDPGHMEAFVAEVDAAKALLLAELPPMGFEVLSTPANFILLKTADPAAFARELRTHDVYVRDRSDTPQLGDFVRVTVGTLEHCRRLLEILKRHAPNS